MRIKLILAGISELISLDFITKSFDNSINLIKKYSLIHFMTFHY